MGDHVDSVKELTRSYHKWAQDAEKAGDPGAKKGRLEWAMALERIVAEVEDLRKKVAPLPTRLGDLSDIPPSLRSELSGIEVDALEGQLLQVINAYGGTADLNQVLVGLFRKFKVEQTRRFVQQKLWRMTTDGLVWSVPKRKGVYTTAKPPAPEASTSTTTAADEDDDFADFGSPGPAKRPVVRKPNDDDEIPF